MAAGLGFLRVCGFSNISRRGLPIARKLVSRNLHPLTRSTGIGDYTLSSIGIIGKHPISMSFSNSYGSLSSRGLMPVLWRSLTMFSGNFHHSKVVLNTGHVVKPLYGNVGNTRLIVLVRNINIMSKRGKRKTCKAVAKRVHRTGKGKLKRWRAGKNHGMIRKSNKRRKQLKKPTYCNKQQLKLLNKMLNGW